MTKNHNTGIVKTHHGFKLQVIAKNMPIVKVWYAHCKDLAVWPILHNTIAHNLMQCSNKCHWFVDVNSQHVQTSANSCYNYLYYIAACISYEIHLCHCSGKY